MELEVETTNHHLKNIRLSKTNRHLVVDDCKTSRAILKLFIESRSPSLVVDEAENGEAALVWIGNVGTDGYDVIWTDLNMDVMDGVELVKEVRKLGYRKYLIVVTGTKDTEMLAACEDIGVDLICRKPVLKRMLHQLPVMQYFT